jgi:protein ImuA
MSSLRARQLVVLRDRMRRLEKPRAAELPVLSLGIRVLDDALPWGGLPTGVLHEILGRPGDAAACGFAVRLLRDLVILRRRPVLWCCNEEAGAPYAPGLTQAGLASEDVIFVQAHKPAELLWAMEEALRSGAFAAVLGEGVAPDLTATRRLRLAAEAGATTALLLLPYRAAGGVSAALTRWQVTAVPVEEESEASRWQIELSRCRGGTSGAWHVSVGQATGDAAPCLRLAAVLAHRPLVSDAAD